MASHDATEIQLKVAVLNHLVQSKQLKRNCIIANELPLGRTSVRADLVTLASNNHVCGIEIKSNRDSLTRLERQLSVYETYFDRVILVVGEKHLARVSNMPEISAEIWFASHCGEIQVIRPGFHVAPTKSGVDLLTVEQAKRAATETSERDAYCDALRFRFAETSEAFWTATARRKVDIEDLRLLSRFDEMRSRACEAKAQRASIWEQWSQFFAAQNSVQSSSVS